MISLSFFFKYNKNDVLIVSCQTKNSVKDVTAYNILNLLKCLCGKFVDLISLLLQLDIIVLKYNIKFSYIYILVPSCFELSRFLQQSTITYVKLSFCGII